MIAFGKREVNRNRLCAGAYFQCDLVVLQQQLELFQKVMRIQLWPCQCGFKVTRASDKAVAELRNVRRLQDGARHCFGVDANKGVTGAHMTGQGFARHIALHGAPQVRNLLVIDDAYLTQRRFGVGVAGRGDEGWQVGHEGNLFLG